MILIKTKYWSSRIDRIQYIQQLKLCYRDIASLPYIPISAVMDTHT